jgi:hypothetical protein
MDRAKLDYAIAACDQMVIDRGYASITTGDMRQIIDTLMEAGRNERARLPPIRRIEIERWTVIGRDGRAVWGGVFNTKSDAEIHADWSKGHVVVRLSGAATVGDPAPTPPKVATDNTVLSALRGAYSYISSPQRSTPAEATYRCSAQEYNDLTARLRDAIDMVEGRQ